MSSTVGVGLTLQHTPRLIISKSPLSITVVAIRADDTVINEILLIETVGSCKGKVLKLISSPYIVYSSLVTYARI